MVNLTKFGFNFPWLFFCPSRASLPTVDYLRPTSFVVLFSKQLVLYCTYLYSDCASKSTQRKASSPKFKLEHLSYRSLN